MKDKTITEFQQGDKDAFEHLFHMLYPGMCLFSKKFVGDYDDAEDIVQEMFIELWHQHKKFESLNQIKAFLYLSIKNKCLNFKKHQTIKDSYSRNIQFENESSFEENIIEVEVVINLNKAIENLPEQQKQVILKSIQGLSNNEIADNMQISINTVKLHKKKAYKQLREKLGSSLFILSLLF